MCPLHGTGRRVGGARLAHPSAGPVQFKRAFLLQNEGLVQKMVLIGIRDSHRKGPGLTPSMHSGSGHCTNPAICDKSARFSVSLSHAAAVGEPACVFVRVGSWRIRSFTAPPGNRLRRRRGRGRWRRLCRGGSGRRWLCARSRWPRTPPQHLCPSAYRSTPRRKR